ncbi:hypothetical protein N431DRAFT_464142 [Stipitochalara longipes BDJ]|nr:hypothetical protein N431DRAFT_464142 [Stipitochalara longipes BDJ]
MARIKTAPKARASLSKKAKPSRSSQHHDQISKAKSSKAESSKDREARRPARDDEIESDDDDGVYLDVDEEVANAPHAAAQTSAEDGAQFHFFPKLPTEVRLKIWSLNAPSSKVLIQSKPLFYRPKYTQLDSRPTPAVLRVCRESRKEFLYREDDAANNSGRQSHAMYARLFPDERFKMSFFSFEIDALHLMTFKVAESVVRDNLRTIIIGPSPHLSIFFLKFDEFRLVTEPNTNHLRAAINDLPSGSWYVEPHINNPGVASNSTTRKYTLLIGDVV